MYEYKVITLLKSDEWESMLNKFSAFKIVAVAPIEDTGLGIHAYRIILCRELLEEN